MHRKRPASYLIFFMYSAVFFLATRKHQMQFSKSIKKKKKLILFCFSILSVFVNSIISQIFNALIQKNITN